MDDVTNLLRNAEEDGIGRRQLLRALGLTATAGFVAAAWPKAAFAGQAAKVGGQTFPVTTMNHLSYAVPVPYPKVRDWYIDLLGMTCVWDDTTKCELDFGSPINGIYVTQGKPDGKPTIGHFGLGIENFMAHKAAMKAEMDRRGLANIRPDGEHGWISDDPAGYMLNTWIPVRDPAMFPGAAAPCAEADSAKCKEGLEAGHKNLASIPKPSGKAFKAIAFSMISLRVPEGARDKEKEFYTNALGMKVVSDKPDELVLRFGQNTLNIRSGQGPDGKPICDTFGLLIANYDHAKVKAELDRRGLSPKEVSRSAWGITDPAGYPIEIAGKSST
jgi:catechol 2,3-dioxygenase-like lactoylglutathione lyase family enzyme